MARCQELDTHAEISAKIDSSTHHQGQTQNLQLGFAKCQSLCQGRRLKNAHGNVSRTRHTCRNLCQMLSPTADIEWYCVALGRVSHAIPCKFVSRRTHSKGLLSTKKHHRSLVRVPLFPLSPPNIYTVAVPCTDAMPCPYKPPKRGAERSTGSQERCRDCTGARNRRSRMAIAGSERRSAGAQAAHGALTRSASWAALQRGLRARQAWPS